jgi:predicted enzyme related to lactoylglutathione lyase
MGRPVVHFEVIGKDGDRLREYYAGLFDWKFDVDNPMNYGIVKKEDNPAPDGSLGIGGGVAGYDEVEGGVTFYVAVPDVEEALAKAEALGGSRVMGPEKIGDMVELGQFKDPEGHVVGVVKDSM